MSTMERRVVVGVTDKGRAVVDWFQWLERAHPEVRSVFSPYVDSTDCGFGDWLRAGADPHRMAGFFRPPLY